MTKDDATESLTSCYTLPKATTIQYNLFSPVSSYDDS